MTMKIEQLSQDEVVVKEATSPYTLDDYFPHTEIDSLEEPLLDYAIVQMKRSFTTEKTKSGLIYIPGTKSEEQKDMEEWHETIAKVISIGPAFYKDPTTLEPWPETKLGIDVKPGDYVRISKFSTTADKFSVKTRTNTTNGNPFSAEVLKIQKESGCVRDEEYYAKFARVKPVHIMSKIKDPLKAIHEIKTYVKVGE